jgi:hypothetical protein
MPQTETDLGSLVQKKGSLETELRRETARRLLALIAAPGSRISPLLAADFLEVSAREVYRWRDSVAGLWIPKLAHCSSINNFVDLALELREAWPKAIEKWKAAKFSDLPGPLLSSFVRPSTPGHPQMLGIMEDPELTDAERAEALTIRSLRNLRDDLKARSKKSAESTEDENVKTS